MLGLGRGVPAQKPGPAGQRGPNGQPMGKLIALFEVEHVLIS